MIAAPAVAASRRYGRAARGAKLMRRRIEWTPAPDRAYGGTRSGEVRDLGQRKSKGFETFEPSRGRRGPGRNPGRISFASGLTTRLPLDGFGVSTMSEENVRGFTGWWIPEELRTNYGLSWAECHLWAEIHALSKGPNGCFASNEHFAKHLDLTERRVRQILGTLKAAGLVRQVGFDGRSRKLESAYPVSWQGGNKFPGRGEENFPPEGKKISADTPPLYREKENSKVKPKEEERTSALPPPSIPVAQGGVKARRNGRNVPASPEARAIIQAFAEVYRARFRSAYVPDPKADVTAATFFLDAGVTAAQVSSTFEAATRSKGFWASKATTLPVLFRRWNEIQAELAGPAKAQPAGRPGPQPDGRPETDGEAWAREVMEEQPQ